MDTADADALDRQDMARLLAGEDGALDNLMDRHAPPVFRYLCRMLGNEEDANDLAQETFVRVFRARASYRAEQRFTAWLFTIATNLARNQLRWRSRHPNIPLEAGSESTGPSPGDSLPSNLANPHQATVALERIEAVRAAVRDLPDDMREAIVLCEWEELAVAEAATVLQSTPKAVEARLYRARKILREQLSRWL